MHLLPPLSVLVLGTALAGAAAAQPAACPPPEWPSAELAKLKQGQWKLPDTPRREALAAALLPCLAHPDPELRDGVAFEAYSAWLRGKQLSVATQRLILQNQLAQLAPAAPDPAGFAKPFAALVLSEVARADRIQAFMTPEERAALVDAGTRYLTEVRDFRGFATGEGWRHGVAHAADLMLQLALNPAVDKAQLERIAGAVQVMVTPPGEHFYIYGEGERLARPVLYAAKRGLLDAAFWKAYIDKLQQPPPGTTWRAALGTQAGLARMHNLKAFLYALQFNVRESGDPALQALLGPPLLEALK